MAHLKPLRIVFFGTTNFAMWHLHMLAHLSVHKIIAVFTQEIRSSKSFLFLYEITKKYSISLFQSRILSIADIVYIIKKIDVDLIIVASYGLILPQEILNIPRLGCINIHGSLLPRWRGPAPIQRALEYGDSITGITIIQMDLGIDTGDILHIMPCKIFPKDTSYTLSNRLVNIGSTMLFQVLDQFVLGTFTLIPQDPTYATYAHKLNKQEARINWNLSAIQLERCVRAFNPWPISYFQIKNDRIRIRVWDAEVSNQNVNNRFSLSSVLPGTILATDLTGIHVGTGSGILILTMLQIAGKKITPVRDILNAYQEWFKPNSVLE
ncbi:methionyl-tRNA formyltransferase [Blochmannia endosymbiont of Camponotus sp. C-003]|uniref:methionyl-tRNA formyltransferase n=1 Tax=unclassified Candidatus Blochmanniella TaxID=711328 RepID=UPI0020244445|nr:MULTISPECIES: methionyl-tRNA formyltransferase [unclassified Candidatus Blochmannia]URJ23586.1 methionyl-tRNA formyltransferase [Blochmannia endosymbiont of Camponotus sp. C-003]URJ28502.1 methionyl-tRNA formyltransferase [Blochmannia endosymbiont of Camponotus sp. C-046]